MMLVGNGIVVVYSVTEYGCLQEAPDPLRNVNPSKEML
jgi:hypothetical protein